MTSGAPAPSPAVAPSRRPYLLGRAALFAVLVLVAAVRVRLRDVPLERDEGEYAYAGQLILQGVPPYTLAYNMKFPGTYAAYALLMTVFGQTAAGVRLGLMVVTTMTALMIYWVSRRLLDETAGLVAAASFAVLAASPAMCGLAAHATHFCALFAAAGLCALWPPGRTMSWKRAGAGGFLFGLAVLMKQHAAVLWLWGAGSLAIAGLRQRDGPWLKRVEVPAAFCVGSVLPLGMTCLILWHVGVLERFWFWTVLYARQYASMTTIKGDAPVAALAGVMENTSALWFLAVTGIGFVWRDDRLRGIRGSILTFALASFLATCPGLLFRDQYFLVTLPAVALLAGSAVSGIQRSSVPFASQAGLAYAFLLAASILQLRDVWLYATPQEVSRLTYSGNPFVEAELVADYIQQHSTPETRIAVVGSEPQIYFLSRRRSATGYIYMYPLMESQPFAARMQQEMIAEIESARPEYVVYVTSTLSWLREPSSNMAVFDWWTPYSKGFTPVLAAVADQEHGTRLLSSAELGDLRESPGNGLLLFRRR